MRLNEAEPLAVECIRELLSYDPATGILRWKVRLGSRAGVGDIAGFVSGGEGHKSRIIEIGGFNYHVSTLIWAIVTGHFPKHEINRRDGDRLNDRWDNLREATHAQNSWGRKLRNDNTSGYKGVTEVHSERQVSRRWMARIRVNGRMHRLGCFGSPELASAKYEEAARELHGEFYRCP